MSVTTDLDIDRDIWNGQIAIAFYNGDVAPASSSNELYVLAPRCGYLTLCTEKIRRKYNQIGPQTEENATWYEFQGKPLKWNYPIGVLYDCFGAELGLPWRIAVHFQNYPKDLLPSYNISLTESHFLWQVKEAAYIKHGSSQIDGLQKSEDKHNLWMGVYSQNFEQFRKVNERLMTRKQTDVSWFKRAPVRLYILQKDREMMILQEPFHMLSTDGTGTIHTLKDLLVHMFHPVVPQQILLHGIEPPLNTPMQWLTEHCSYPDSFLHIVVRIPPGCPSCSEQFDTSTHMCRSLSCSHVICDACVRRSTPAASLTCSLCRFIVVVS